MSQRFDDGDLDDGPRRWPENPFLEGTPCRESLAPIVAVGTVEVESDVSQDERRRAIGGTAAHFGLSARFLAPVELIGRVQADFDLDDFAVLSQPGVITRGIRRREQATAPARVPYSPRGPSVATDEDHGNASVICWSTNRPSAVYLAGISPEEQLNLVRRNPDTDILAIDIGREWYGAARADIMAAIRNAEVVFLNSWHARLLTGVSQFVGAARYLQELGAGVVVLRHAEYGASAFADSDVIKLPAFPLTEVVDPTGAGASFAGGFLGALVRSGSLDRASLNTAMLCGTVVASFTIEDVGVDRSLALSREDLANRYDALVAMV